MSYIKYKEIDSNPNFAEIEKEILKQWEEDATFNESIKNRDGNQEFIFYDGPPFANGMPHYGHLLTGFAKDAIARFQTMIGKKVERKFGWDCHGLPAEMHAEKSLNISGKKAIQNFGIDKFNNYCRESVMMFADKWQQYINRQARWVDFKNDYKTMDIEFMESVIWGFKELYNKNLIYKSMQVMPYSWACETPLSNFETRMDNSYRQKTSKTVTVLFKAKGKINAFSKATYDNCYFLVWTTTPWTLPSNLALAINKNIAYSAIQHDNNLYICASSQAERLSKIIGKSIGNTKLLQEQISGNNLIDIEYFPLFEYFKDTKNAFKVLSADFVTDTDGTGIVHCAPGFGEDDFRICAQNNIPIICPVDDSGKFTSEVEDYCGMHVFDTNDKIIIELKNKKMWAHTEQYIHQYPHCWRTDTPLIYKALSSWYVKVTDIKDKMIELNKQINWIPGHIKNGQFGKWLENARDWSISRKRFWGTPIPVWESNNKNYPRTDVYGSIAEIEKDFNVTIKDLHRPFIDSVKRKNPDDRTGQSEMHRIEDVFDCWFESGSMPYAQKHYPFENKKQFQKNFPADFIVEYVAQTRGWFYTLLVLSTALFDKHPFKNCICHGVVLDESGQKLSKRLNNYVDPIDVMEKYGSDSLRFLMLSSPVMQGGNLLLDKDCEMIRDTLRLKVKPIWNAYYFFAVYANADKITPNFNNNPNAASNKINTYIMIKCKNTVKQIHESMESYDTIGACKAIEEFFEILNNWYIRRSKKHFWQSEYTEEKQNAYDTLFSILHIMCRAVAPLLPLISEFIYKNLTEKSAQLSDFPRHEDIMNKEIDNNLIKAMDTAREICNVVLAIRNEHNIRIRQPLQSLTYFTENAEIIDEYTKSIIKDEVNIKDFIISTDISNNSTYKLQLIFSEIAKRIPNKMKDILEASKQNTWQEQNNELHIANTTLKNNEYKIILEPVKPNSKALLDNRSMVLLDIETNEDLIVEGIARDLVRLIQERRKQMKFNVSDKIQTTIYSTEQKIVIACEKWDSYIKEQTLSQSIKISQNTTKLTIKFNVLDTNIGIELTKQQ